MYRDFSQKSPNPAQFLQTCRGGRELSGKVGKTPRKHWCFKALATVLVRAQERIREPSGNFCSKLELLATGRKKAIKSSADDATPRAPRLHFHARGAQAT